MSIRIDRAKAEKILLEEAELASVMAVPETWRRKLRVFSEACESTSKTHIAFLCLPLAWPKCNVPALPKIQAPAPGARPWTVLNS